VGAVCSRALTVARCDASHVSESLRFTASDDSKPQQADVGGGSSCALQRRLEALSDKIPAVTPCERDRRHKGAYGTGRAVCVHGKPWLTERLARNSVGTLQDRRLVHTREGYSRCGLPLRPRVHVTQTAASLSRKLPSPDSVSRRRRVETEGPL